ncbi:unnamed protein product [Linum trigynum]|uniref:Uncharacterized protein n=1 Tax=Linum trigynum TaxID=586398 RepID=A0AAV2FU48_9ROSI
MHSKGRLTPPKCLPRHGVVHNTPLRRHNNSEAMPQGTKTHAYHRWVWLEDLCPRGRRSLIKRHSEGRVTPQNVFEGIELIITRHVEGRTTPEQRPKARRHTPPAFGLGTKISLIKRHREGRATP